MTSSYYWSAERFFQTAPLTRIQNYSVNPFVITVKLLTASFLSSSSLFFYVFIFFGGGGRGREEAVVEEGGALLSLTIKIK